MRQPSQATVGSEDGRWSAFVGDQLGFGRREGGGQWGNWCVSGWMDVPAGLALANLARRARELGAPGLAEAAERFAPGEGAETPEC